MITAELFHQDAAIATCEIVDACLHLTCCSRLAVWNGLGAALISSMILDSASGWVEIQNRANVNVLAVVSYPAHMPHLR